MKSIKVSKAPDGKLKQQVVIGEHLLYADVPEASGGDDAGPDPHELLDAALGTCTALTVTMVARHKKMPLTDVQVEVSHHEADGLYHMDRKIEFVGDLTLEQRQYLLGIANKCPVHKTLSGRFEIVTTLTQAP